MLQPSTVVLSVEADSPEVVLGAVGDSHEAARLLVWDHGAPVGILDVGLDPSNGANEDVAALVGRARARTHTVAAPRREVDATQATVVVATCDRPHLLDRCLDALWAADGQGFAVIVVDNAPGRGDVAGLLERHRHPDRQLRYVAEPAPGLASAHNAAMAEVATDYVLFTDDDVVVDRRWVQAMVRALDDEPRAGCVTGLIMPTELETETQWLLEESIGYGKGFERRVFDDGPNRPDDPLFPFTAGTLGSGANMGFRVEHLRAIGGFDPALGAGSRGAGGDDLAAFMETIVGGRAVVYEPSAVVFHPHHRDPAGALRQARSYGTGLTAALTSVVSRHPRLVWTMLRRAPGGIRHAVSSSSRRNSRRPASYPAAMVRAELWGMARGPFAYAMGRLDLARRARAGAGS